MAEPVEPLIDSHNILLATLLDQTHECIELLDRDGRILFVNREGANSMELTLPADLIGQLWVERWPAAVRTGVEAALASARSGEVARVSAARPGPDQSLRWWDITVTPVRSDHGEPSRFLTIARDVTAEVTDRQRVAAISAEMRHRLKNALTVASGLVMMSARSRPEARTFAEHVTARFAQLSTVQDLILDPLSSKRFADIIPLLASAYGDASLLEFGDLPDVRLTDAAMQALALAFGELATNSLKYGALKLGRAITIGGEADGEVLHLTWREQTDFGPVRDGGQGLGLVERLVRASGGTFERQHDNGVFVARLSLPILG
ncbi:PAS domain-containing protein [Sphingomonas sp. ERG5]|uniref:PAS domain-containing protein n=1 Tax=Sphingomonas sp. ERG5 TaxID=1381597 RepID=UPI000A7FD643|nr:PAS domain-containing protein [Sphingomonas sp. ERG5]